MGSPQVVIDALPDSVRRYGPGWAVVAIDVIRATTTAATAVSLGRRCYPVPSIEAALPLAARLSEPLLVGELGGNMPFGFDLTNSPFEIAARKDVWRPMILLSSNGTQVICSAAEGAEAAYIACLRNLRATVQWIAGRHQRVALIGAGTRGQFREEDQFCCARIAEGLLAAGYEPEGPGTLEVLRRWADQPFDAWRASPSVDYLTRTNQLRDLEFILGHRDDLGSAFRMHQGEIVELPVAPEAPTLVQRTAVGE